MSKGKLKVFLGYAAGVGKTYRMLLEARQLCDQGRDVVIGYFEPHGRKDTIALTAGLETVPRKVYEHRGSVFEDMDTEAVIARHPEVAAVDEFAHTNVPGSPRLKRWQDVMLLLQAGIDVLTSLNILHMESLNDHVWHVTGIRVRETVPDWILQEASEVVMVDVTPRALLHRLERGVVYAPEKARQAMDNFFTEANLSALRELALRQTAHQIEEKRDAAGRDRILLWLTPHPAAAMLIRRGRRVADYLNSPCTAVFAQRDEAAMEPWLNVCRNLRIDAKAIPCGDPARDVADYARAQGVTQLFVSRNTPELARLVSMARDMQVIIVAERVRTNTA